MLLAARRQEPHGARDVQRRSRRRGAERTRRVRRCDAARFAAGVGVLVAQQRTRMLWSLAGAAVLLVGRHGVLVTSTARVLRVLAPMAMTTLVVVAALQAAGISLTLFHLISLILVAGLGLDYALFFEHAADDPRSNGARCTRCSSARCRRCSCSRCSRRRAAGAACDRSAGRDRRRARTSSSRCC